MLAFVFSDWRDSVRAQAVCAIEAVYPKQQGAEMLLKYRLFAKQQGVFIL